MPIDVVFSYEGDLPPGAKYRGISLEIYKDDKTIGKLTLGKGGLTWKSKGKKKSTYRLGWDDLPAIFEDRGRPTLK